MPGDQVNCRGGGPMDVRGCQGSVTPIQFGPGVQEKALQAAFGDCRWKPVLLPEVQYLQAKVAVLHSYEPMNDIWDWKVGIFGVVCFGF